ncbi:MAG: FAD-dependent oxidoreductase [Halopseudomonas aestusnigri]
MKSHARIVVIGGGAVGCSAAYHLAKMGCTDVVLLEMDELTSGSTWHAAGNCPTYSSSVNIMKMQKYGVELYGELAEEVDYPMNYSRTGSIRLAQSDERMFEFEHVKAMAKAQGLDYEIMTPNEMKDIYPFLETHKLEGGLWDPLDGDIDPSQLTQAYAKGARDLGVKILRFNRVTAIEQTPNGEWRVDCEKGSITCEKVINAGGYRGGEIAAMVGQYIPIVSLSHQYLVTDAIPELEALDKKLPLLRDPDDSYYLRQERDGLILGPYEWKATPHWLDGLPENFASQLWNDDLERIEWYIEQAMARVPVLEKGGVARVINGPIPYTPDGLPYIGPAYGLDNFYHCCGFSFGITQSGGAGKIIAEQVLEGESEWDMWMFDPRRYTDYGTQKYVVDKAIEVYQNEYAIPFPHEERSAGRPAKMTPVYDKLKQKGAFFGARGGWERAVWFPLEGEQRPEEQTVSFLDDRRNWTDAVRAECKAVRERVGVLDLGGFTKYEVSGPGATEWLDYMIAGKMPKIGGMSLSYFLSRKGHVMTEMTITRLAEDQYWLISAGAGEWHDEDWLLSNMPGDGSVEFENITDGYGTLVVAGPRSRDLLSKITKSDLSNKAFPWLTTQAIEIGFSPDILAMRVNYVGELGWELHVPLEFLGHVYDEVMAAGEEFEVADFGLYTMDSLRLEKCYRSWKVDIIHEYTPYELSLDRFIDVDKGPFMGREALKIHKENGIKERFVPLIIDTNVAEAPYCSPIYQGDDIVGITSSGGYGYHIDKNIALSFVRTDLAVEGTKLEVSILGQRYPAVVSKEPLYDPKNLKLRDVS